MHYNTLVFLFTASLATFSLAVPVPIEAQISPLNKKDVDLDARQWYEDDAGKRSVNVEARQFYEDDAGR